jgi:NDP-sugar pyrophosphorylase family protein
MLPVADRPLMERTVEQLRQAGVRRLNITTHYLSEKIISHFGDGARFGVEIDYVRENEPLGTAGALKMLHASDEPILVVNGDVLTRVDYRAFHAFHREQNADMTIGVRAYKIQVPYGVVECHGPEVVGLTEKPEMKLFVNAGVYLLEPTVQAHLPAESKFDMTDLIARLLAAGKTVVSFPIVEYWIDVGRTADYEQADSDLRRGGSAE